MGTAVADQDLKFSKELLKTALDDCGLKEFQLHKNTGIPRRQISKMLNGESANLAHMFKVVSELPGDGVKNWKKLTGSPIDDSAFNIPATAEPDSTSFVVRQSPSEALRVMREGVIDAWETQAIKRSDRVNFWQAHMWLSDDYLKLAKKSSPTAIQALRGFESVGAPRIFMYRTDEVPRDPKTRERILSARAVVKSLLGEKIKPTDGMTEDVNEFFRSDEQEELIGNVKSDLLLMSTVQFLVVPLVRLTDIAPPDTHEDARSALIVEGLPLADVLLVFASPDVDLFAIQYNSRDRRERGRHKDSKSAKTNKEESNNT